MSEHLDRLTRDAADRERAAHTPGPWRVNTASGMPYQIVGETRAILNWGSFTKPSQPESLANARLIAAAPDLLTACRAIVAFHSSVFLGRPLEIDGRPIDHTLLNVARQLAETAIRKAEGR